MLLPAHEAVINVEADGNATDVERGVRVDGVVVALVGEHEAARRRLGRQRDAETRSRRDGRTAIGHQLASRNFQERAALTVAHDGLPSIDGHRLT